MQVVATAALAMGTLLAHAITQAQAPLLTQALNVMLGWGGLDPVFLVTPAAVGGGILLGMLLGGTLAFADSRGRVPPVLALLALLPFLLSWLSLTDRLPVAPATLHALANYGWLGLPLLCGVPGIWRDNLPAIALGALLLLVQPLTLEGNDVAALLPILGFIICFMLYIELAYDHLRYARLARIMHHSTEFEAVLNWFGVMLLLTLACTTALTAAAFGFHEVLGEVLPARFRNSIEFNTIYGRALSVMVFFTLWAIAQTTFSRQFLARQVE